MSPTTRAFLTKAHLVLAALMFPAVLMFLATGALYTWGETGDYVDTEHRIALTQPLTNDEGALTVVAARELARLDIAPPSGSPSVRTLDDAYRFEWSGSNRDVQLSPTADPLVAILVVKETTLHRRLVQLHKAKGATAFKIYATILAIALFLLVLSGIIMGLATPSLRRMTIWASGLGTALFAGAVALG
jgi:hypothetical protein